MTIRSGVWYRQNPDGAWRGPRATEADARRGKRDQRQPETGREVVTTRRRVLTGVLAVVAVAALLVGATLPSRARAVDPSAFTPMAGTTIVRGAYHMHTTRSDGSGSLDDVARAAAAAGLDFVIVSDHGDAARPPEPPAYRAGVLVVDGVEISTASGHYVALGLDAAPYPLGGDPADVVADVARLGGIGIAAHPDSSKPALRWTRWDLPIDGFEWVNGDSEWRDESWLALSRTLAHYFVRPVEALATLFDRPHPTLERWDRLGREGRRLVAMAGADAHARLGWRADDGDDDTVDPARLELKIPSYESVFRAFSLQLTMPGPWPTNAAADAGRVLDAIRLGRVTTTVDGLTTGGRIEFVAVVEGETWWQGSLLPDRAARAVFRVSTNAPDGARIVLRRNGLVVARSSGVSLTHEAHTGLQAGERAAQWRAEVLLGGEDPGDAGLPWMLTNAIYTGTLQDRRDPPGGTTVNGGGEARDVDLAAGWHVEKDSAADGAIEAGPPMTLRYRLARGDDDTWVAAARRVDGLDAARAIELEVSSDRPLRIAVQLRAPGEARDARWRRSILVGPQPAMLRVPIDTFVPVGRSVQGRPAGVRDVLIVVDRVNALRGTPGTVSLHALRVVQ